jgi:hypothetical protein
MTTGALLWFILFGMAALLFFTIAFVVTIRGAGDLRHLIGSSETQEKDA